jgi:uncharacterized membrane protein
MFEAPLHPKIVHLPIALAILVPLVSLGILVAWFKDWLPSRTWVIVACLQAALFGSALIAEQTGEQDEQKVEKVLQSEEPLEVHEEAAKTFIWGTGIALLLTLLPLGFQRSKYGLPLAALATASTFAVSYLGYEVGHAGGELVYKHGAAEAHVGSEPETSD